jgi:hypothetical protein
MAATERALSAMYAATDLADLARGSLGTGVKGREAPDRESAAFAHPL